MCLSAYSFKELNGETGQGFKVVWQTDMPNEYLSYFSWFSADGRGGARDEEEGYTLPGARYKLNELYEINHTRNAINSKGDHYIAGIHLYKFYADAEVNRVFGTVIIECEYYGAIAEDYTSIAVRAVKPLGVVHVKPK